MCPNFLRIDISSSRVKCWLMSACVLCFLCVVAVLSINRVVKEFAADIVTVKSMASWGIGAQGSSVKYSDLKTSFFISPKIIITDLVIDTLYASFEIDRLIFSYGLFSKNSVIKFSDGYLNVSTGEQTKREQLKCKVGSGLGIKWRDSMAFYFLKRILFGKKITNSVVKVYYVDDVGAYCANNKGEEESIASVYEKFRILLSFSEDESLKADALLSLKGKEGMRGLSLDMDNVLVRKNGNDGATEVNIPLLRLEGESFSAKLHGYMLISQKCALMSFRRCKYNMSLEIRGFDELSNFIRAGISGLFIAGAGGGNSKNAEHFVGLLNSIFDVIRSSAEYIEDGDITKISLSSTEKEGLAIGGVPINKMMGDVVKRLSDVYDIPV